MINFDNKDKDTQAFAKALIKLDGASVIGLTRLLKVKVFHDEVKDENGKPLPRSGESIIEDCLVKFHALNRADRRNILKLVKKASKAKK